MTLSPSILRVGDEPPPLDAQIIRSPGNASKTKGKPSSRGRFESINAFIDKTLATLERAELACWLILWRDTKPNGLARTSQDDLAHRAGCNPRTVRRALARLEKKGLLCVVTQGGWPRRLSVYRVLPMPP